ncbi:helix-hairpin-helix domain-containing protein [Maridesulfovibrio ferrireducens]|uniref:BRCT domain-containing protein n=1 Tax=Maridesulfovibrio ferrireducens TaxID=246191 RepID=UPI001A32734A|nr:helix-hairpin-helix domain-containing protein [Maridesulfovibrio ferrireducens]MBI9112227.1 DNA ligase [Maridesulfovibrio ferrireducens]
MSNSELVTKLTEANEAYRAGNSIMDDHVYDEMLDELRATDPDNKFLHAVEPEKSDRLKVRHASPMLSTEKAYSIAEIEKFIERCETAAAEIGLDEVFYLITPKLDGMAAHWDGERLTSRGDGETGFDITDALHKGILICPDEIGPGEIVVDKAYFKHFLSENYSHPRNFIAGNILADELSKKAQRAFGKDAVRFANFGHLKRLFGPPCSGKDIMGALTDEEWIADAYQLSDPIDGLVLEVTNSDLKKHLGSTSHHHRWQIAFKRKGETAETTVKAIRWQVGRTGAVTPVIEIEPVNISGAKISNVTGHNSAYIEDKCIGVGTRLRIVRAGEVIPKVDEVLKATTPRLPSNCPECGGWLHREGVNLICDAENCVARQCRQKEHFFKTLDIKGFGPSTVEKMATVPLHHFFDQMDDVHYIGFGFGKTQSVNLNSAIQDRKANPVNPAKFLAALGIDGLGESTAKKILTEMSFMDLVFATPDALMNIPSIGAATASSIVAGLQNNLSLIEKLIHHFKFEVSTEPESGSIAGKMTGMSVVFTGKMETGSRKDCENLAIQNGANVQGSITATTTHLICGANVGKAKTDKAAKSGAKVLSEAEFLKLIKS